MPAFVEARGLTKDYGPVAVLRGVSLDIRAGERVAVLGKSGSGKSTLLHLLAGLDVPSAGSLVVAGRDLAALSRNDRADYRRLTVGVVFQAFHLVPTRDALGNVEVPLTLAGVPRRERRRRAAEALDAVGLGHRLTHRPAELSGGERQRVAVARALINRPRLVLADEPTGNLDSATGQEVAALLFEHVRATGAALVLVTHDEELARAGTDRVCRMADGRLADGG